MGQVGGTGVKGSLGVAVIGVGVGNRHGAKLLGFFHKLQSAGQLRGHIHNPHQAAAALIELLEALEVRSLQVIGVLGAFLLLGEVGAFHLNAPQHRAALGLLVCQTAGTGKSPFQHLIGQGHGGGGKGGDAALGIVGSHLL